jgi:hypothetical protein
MSSPSEDAPPVAAGPPNTNEARARLELGGRAVLDDVGVHLRPPGDRRGGWDGYFVLPAGQSVPTEGTFRLIFRDGRRGYVELPRPARGPAPQCERRGPRPRPFRGDRARRGQRPRPFAFSRPLR